jgi:hypothetical protein
MNNRSDRLGPMGKPLNGVASGVDSVVWMWSSEFKEKIESDIGRDITSKNFGYHVDQKFETLEVDIIIRV